MVAFPTSLQQRSNLVHDDQYLASQRAGDDARAHEPLEVHYPSAPVVAAPRQADESPDAALDRIFGAVHRAARPVDSRLELRSTALAAAHTWYAAACMALARRAEYDPRVDLARRQAELGRELDAIARTLDAASSADARTLTDGLRSATQALAVVHPGPAVLCKPRQTGAPAPSADPTDLLRAAHALGGGAPLSAEARAAYEAHLADAGLHADLGSVTLHAGADADALCAALGARAVTIGTKVAFAAGELAPTTASGQALLAHELTHVAQAQTRSLPSGVVPASSPLEAEADAVAGRALGARTQGPVAAVATRATRAAPGGGAVLLRRKKQDPGSQDAAIDDARTVIDLDAVATTRTVFAEVASVLAGTRVAPPPVCVVGVGTVAPVAHDDLGNDAETHLAWKRITERDPTAWSEYRMDGAKRLAAIADAERRIQPHLTRLREPRVFIPVTGEWLDAHYFARVEVEKRRAHADAADGALRADQRPDPRLDLDRRASDFAILAELTNSKAVLDTTFKIVTGILDGAGAERKTFDNHLQALMSRENPIAFHEFRALAPRSSVLDGLQGLASGVSLGIQVFSLADPDERRKLLAEKTTTMGDIGRFLKVESAILTLAKTGLAFGQSVVLCVGKIAKNVGWVNAALRSRASDFSKALGHAVTVVDVAANVATLFDSDATNGERIEAGTNAAVIGIGAATELAGPIGVGMAIAVPLFSALAREGHEAARGPVIGALRAKMFPQMEKDARAVVELARRLSSAARLLTTTTDPARRAALEGKRAQDETKLRAVLAPYLEAVRGTKSTRNPADPSMYGPALSIWFQAIVCFPLTTHEGHLGAAQTFVEVVARCFSRSRELITEVADGFVKRHTL